MLFNVYIYQGLYIHSFALLNPLSQKLHPFELGTTGVAARKVCASPSMPQLRHVRGQGHPLPPMELHLWVMNPPILRAWFIFSRRKESWLGGRVGALGLRLLAPPTLPGNTLPMCAAQLLSNISPAHPQTDKILIYIKYTHVNT